MIDEDSTVNGTENHVEIAAAYTTAYLYGSKLYCGNCLHAFTCPTHLKIHFHIEHEPKCPCGQSFNDKQTLLSHAEQVGCKLPFPFEWRHFESSESDDSSEDETIKDDDILPAKSETAQRNSHISDRSAAANSAVSDTGASDYEGNTSASDDDVEKFDADQLDCPQDQKSSQCVKTPSMERSCEACGRTFASRCSYSGHLHFCRAKTTLPTVVNSTSELKKSLKQLYGVIGTSGKRYRCRICKRRSVKLKIIYDHVREDHPAKFRQCLKKKPLSEEGLNPKCQRFINRFATDLVTNDTDNPNLAAKSVAGKLEPTGTGSKPESDGILRNDLSASDAVENTGDDGTRCHYCSRWFSTTSCRLIHQRSCSGRRHFVDMQFVRRSFSLQSNGQVRCQLCDHACSPWNPAFIHIRRQHLNKLQKWRAEVASGKKNCASSKQPAASEQEMRLPSTGTKYSGTASVSSRSKSTVDSLISDSKSELLLHSSISEADKTENSPTRKQGKKSSVECADFPKEKFENPSPTAASMRCPHCQLKFESSSLCKAHMPTCRRRQREKGGTYDCQFCSRAFLHSSNRCRHEKTCRSRRSRHDSSDAKSETHQNSGVKVQELITNQCDTSLTYQRGEGHNFPCQFCHFIFHFSSNRSRHEKICPMRHSRSDVKSNMNESCSVKQEADAETNTVFQRAKCVTYCCRFCSRPFLHRFVLSRHEKICPLLLSGSDVKSEMNQSSTIKQETSAGRQQSDGSSVVYQKRQTFSPNSRCLICPFCQKNFASAGNRHRHELICPSRAARTHSKIPGIQSVASNAESVENPMTKVAVKSEPISSISPGGNYGAVESPAKIVSSNVSSPLKSPGRMLQCCHCGLKLLNKLSYNKHIFRCRHTSNLPLPGSKEPADCKYCHRHFTLRYNCLRHETKCRHLVTRGATASGRSSGHSGGGYQCLACDAKFESTLSLCHHKRYCKGYASKVSIKSDNAYVSLNTPKSKGSTKNECRYCKLPTSTSYNCVTHEKLCGLLQKYLEPIDNSNDNLLSVSPSAAAATDYVYRCKLCGCIFRSWISVKYHFHKIHRNVLRSSGTKASSSSSILPVRHSANPAFQRICSKCHRTFRSYVGYSQHRTTCRNNHRQSVPLHIQEYRISCFKRNTEGRYQCLKCGVSYAERRCVYRHIDSWHPFSSPESTEKTETDDGTSTAATENASCGQLSTKRSTESQQDRRVSTNVARELAYIACNIELLPDRRYRCLICGLTQNCRSNMRSHIRRMHGIPATIHRGLPPSTSAPSGRTPPTTSGKRPADPAPGSPPIVRRKVACSKCHTCFFSRASYLMHQRLCSRTFVSHRRKRNSRVLAYLNSMCKLTPDEERWQCVICGHTYKYKRDVVRHVGKCHGLPAGVDSDNAAGPSGSSSKLSPVKSSPAKSPGKT